MGHFARFTTFTLFVSCLAPLAGSPSAAQSALQSRALITQTIDETRLVQLQGNTRVEARAANDQGVVDDSLVLKGMQLLLKRSPSQEAAAEQLADEVNKPGAAHFHEWLTADIYAQRFGASLEDIATISYWLSGHGFQVHDASPSRMTINFSGTARQVHEAFHTEIHKLKVGGEPHLANMSDPWIPEALAPVVEGIVSLHDFRPHGAVVARQARPHYTNVPAGVELVVPADIATIYNINPLFRAGLTGKGETIAVIEDSDLYSTDDWATFRTTFGLSTYSSGSLTTIHPGGCTDPGVNPNLDDFEASVDVEYSTATAPGAVIELAACGNTSTTPGVLIALQNLLNERHTPSIISNSYGICEPQNGQTANAAIKAAYMQAVLEGISVFVATGDTGAADCDFISGTGGTGGADAEAVFGLAADGYNTTPYNVSVGGTDFGDLYFGTVANYWSTTNSPTYGSALSYVPEITWNDSCSSILNASFFGFSYTYGPEGFCNNPSSQNVALLLTWAGGGGPSTCATGVPTGGSNSSSVVSGTCRGARKPWWQIAPGNPNDGVRDLPDIAMFAANGIWGHYFVLCYSDPTPSGYGAPCVGDPINWAGGGGTSFAAPMMAGIQALVNQKWGDRQGNPNPVYYGLAFLEYQSHLNCNATAPGGPSATCVFHDITLGNTDVDCAPPYNCYDPGNSVSTPLVGVLSLSSSSFKSAFTAGPGWDFTTGLGSVNAENLVNNPIWAFNSLLTVTQ